MIDRRDDDLEGGLPPELRDLHRELSSLHIEERASFGPELEAELERAWAEDPGLREGSGGRRAPALLAAALGGLLLVGMGVPRARAALGELTRSVTSEVRAMLLAPEEPELPSVVLDAPELDGESSGVSPGILGAPAGGAADVDLDPGARNSGAMRFPDIADRREDRILIESFYPDTLQARRIGGTVELMIWVEPSGEVGDVRVVRGSGVKALDRAALDAAPSLRFRPAARSGRPVGTWVEFGVDFRPPPRPVPPRESVSTPAPRP